MQRFPYRVIIEQRPKDGVWTARVPALNCVATDASAAKALRAVRTAAQQKLKELREEEGGGLVPRGDSGRFVLRCGRTLHAHLARLAAQDGVSLQAECILLLAAGIAALGSEPGASRAALRQQAAAIVRDAGVVTRAATRGSGQTKRATCRTASARSRHAG